MQENCPDCRPILQFIRDDSLPSNDALARKIVFQAELRALLLRGCIAVTLAFAEKYM